MSKKKVSLKDQILRLHTRNKGATLIVCAIMLIGAAYVINHAMQPRMYNCMVFGLYGDGSYEYLGDTNKGIKKALSIDGLAVYNPDNPTKELKGFAVMAFAEFKKPFSEYGGTYILYNYTMDKISDGYHKRVYERPWVLNDQFVKDPGFKSSPTDKLGSNVLNVKSGNYYYYFWRVYPGNAKVVALQDQLPPTEAYPMTYNGVTGNPIIFWIYTAQSEQSYSNQIGLPADGSTQEYKLTLNMLIEGVNGTINPNNSNFTTTIKLMRVKDNVTITFAGDPYVYSD